MKRYIPAACLALAACAGTPKPQPTPIVTTVEVDKPIAGACVPEALTPPPPYVDTDEKLKAAADAAERYQLLWGGRAQRIARLNEIEPVIADCVRGSSK